MIKITEEQSEALVQYKLDNLKRKLLIHVNTHFPAEVEKLTEEQAKEVIDEAIDTCSWYNFKAEYAICKFVNLIFTFGQEFEHKKKHAWATKILNDESQKDQRPKIDRLVLAGMENIENATGIVLDGNDDEDEE